MRTLDKRGAAIAEFAVLAPLLLIMLLGICDLAPTLMARFKFAAASQAVADLVTQTATMQPSDIASDVAGGGDVMAPFSATNLLLRITNIASDGNNRAFVYWSCGQGMTPKAAGSTITSTQVPQLSNLLLLTANGTNTSFVMVETQYTYTPPAGFLLRSPQIMSSVTYTFPRVSTFIGYSASQSANPLVPTQSQVITPASTSGGVTCNLSG